MPRVGGGDADLRETGLGQGSGEGVHATKRWVMRLRSTVAMTSLPMVRGEFERIRSEELEERVEDRRWCRGPTVDKRISRRREAPSGSSRRLRDRERETERQKEDLEWDIKYF